MYWLQFERILDYSGQLMRQDGIVGQEHEVQLAMKGSQEES